MLVLHVACVRSGTKYGPEYVEILRDMICRNLEYGTKGSFHCFTDQPEKPEGVFVYLTEGYGGWWDKLGLFKPGVFPSGRRVWFFDLDTLIVGSLDAIMAYDGPFAALRDFYRPEGLQSSVMTWRAGELDHVWEKWITAGCPRPDGGDQAVIHAVQSKFVALQDVFQRNSLATKCTLGFAFPRMHQWYAFTGNPVRMRLKTDGFRIFGVLEGKT